MRKVIIKYEDGRIEEYKTIKEAANYLRCEKSSIQRMAIGAGAITRKYLRIESIEIKANKGSWKGRRKHGRCKLICTNEDGTVVEADTIKEAYQKLNYKHYINSIIDDGEFHWGWKFDSVKTERKSDLKFENTVDDVVIKKIYRYTHHYLLTYYTIPEEEKEDIQQETTSHVASEYSCGKYEKYKHYNFDRWLYLRVRHYASNLATKYIRHNANRVEPNDYDNEYDGDWIESIAGFIEDDAEKDLLEEMPTEYRKIAKLLLDGRSRIEVLTLLKIDDHERKRLLKELGEWLLKRKK